MALAIHSGHVGNCKRNPATGSKCLLLNFTNPSGLITEALNIYAPGVLTVGVCNSAYTTKMDDIKPSFQVHGEKYLRTKQKFLHWD